MPPTFSCSSFSISLATSQEVYFGVVVRGAGQINRGVKQRQIDDANPVGAAVAVRRFDEFGLGFLVLEFDFIADQSHDAAGGTVFAPD